MDRPVNHESLDSSMQGWIRVLWRFTYFSVTTSIHIIWYLMLRCVGYDQHEAGNKIRLSWLKLVPPHLGIKPKVKGLPLDRPCLYVANHVSYIDPILIMSVVDVFVVAKSEVSRWPLIGWIGKMVGTIYVDRHQKSSRLKTALTIREALESGKSILVFPEGTTSRGNATLEFRPRSFESAWLAGVPVQPIAIQYGGDRVAFIGEDTFLPHFFRLFRAKSIPASITFGPVINSSDASVESRNWIDLMLAPYNMHAA